MQNFTFELDIIKSKLTVKKGDRIVAGYASTFDVDTDKTQITREALEGAKEDLLKYSTVLFNHDPERPIGKVIETAVDDVGLLVKIVLSKEEDEIWNKVKEGILNKFSIKGRALEYVPIEGNEQIYQIKKIELFEVSIVSVPANKEAETISSWIAKTLDVEISKNTKMDKIIERLKTISEKGNDEVKSEIDSIVKQLEKEKNIVSNLQILAGKSEAADRETIEAAIELLKSKEEVSVANEVDKSTKDFNLADESDVRPIFQLNLGEDKIDFEENTNKFKKQILKFGKWFHWDADGGVLNITPEIVENIIKNFKKGMIEHVAVPLTHTNDPSKNTGEVIDLVKTESGLDAVVEIKDETIAEKIKKGIIKCISASIDPNYRIKKTNEFTGPTLLHAALVSEPYIKGMTNFVLLSEEFANRPIIQLEDAEPNFGELLKSIKETMDNIETKMFTEDKANELFFDMMEKKAVPAKGDSCTTDDKKKGKYADEDGKLVCKALSIEEMTEIARSAYTSCVGAEMKGGKNMAEAAKACKDKVKKELEIDLPEDVLEIKSNTESDNDKIVASENVDLADAEKKYGEYLAAGKIVPAQKEVFIKLFASGKVLELGDKTVGLSGLIDQFMKSQPKIVSFEENGTQVTDTEKKEDKGDMPVDVKEFYTKMGLSDENAKTSWDFAKELKAEEAKEKESTIFE